MRICDINYEFDLCDRYNNYVNYIIIAISCYDIVVFVCAALTYSIDPIVKFYFIECSTAIFYVIMKRNHEILWFMIKYVTKLLCCK